MFKTISQRMEGLVPCSGIRYSEIMAREQIFCITSIVGSFLLAFFLGGKWSK